MPDVGNGGVSSAILAALHGDSKLEIICAAAAGPPIIYSFDGKEYGRIKNNFFISVPLTNLSIGDMNNNGTLDIVFGGIKPSQALPSALYKGVMMPVHKYIYAFNGNDFKDIRKSEWEIDDWQFFQDMPIASIEGNDKYAVGGSGLYLLRAYNANGKEAGGWPKFVGGWVIASPAVGDADNDGKTDIVAATREGNLFLWHTNGKYCSKNIDWKKFHHDEMNTGNYNTRLNIQKCDKGCGCGSTSNNVKGDLALIGLILAYLGYRKYRKS